MWTNGVHVCFMFLKHRNGGGNQVDVGGGQGVALWCFPHVERDEVMENRVELSPAASTTSATVCMVLFVILISSDIRKKKPYLVIFRWTCTNVRIRQDVNILMEWISWGTDKRSVTQLMVWTRWIQFTFSCHIHLRSFLYIHVCSRMCQIYILMPYLFKIVFIYPCLFQDVSELQHT